jgi:hypothetical protein
MNRRRVVIWLTSCLFYALTPVRVAQSDSCLGTSFRVKIEVLTCEPGRTDPGYGMIDLKVVAKTLEVQVDNPNRTQYRTQPANPVDVAPLNQTRKYRFPTGNGYLPPYPKIQTCESIIGQQFEMPTNTCFCSPRNTCEELVVQPPDSWSMKP